MPYTLLKMVEAHAVSTATPQARRLLHGSITYSAAQECERNILHEIDYWEQETEFISYLYRRRDSIRSVVAQHLGLDAVDKCHVTEPDQWMRGSFNICIRVDIDDQSQGQGRRVIMRFPLPYRIGETPCPGNMAEKILCEAGTYAWLQENCPDVPIPHLYGFGLSTGQTVRSSNHPSRFISNQLSLPSLVIYLSLYAWWRVFASDC